MSYAPGSRAASAVPATPPVHDHRVPAPLVEIEAPASLTDQFIAEQKLKVSGVLDSGIRVSAVAADIRCAVHNKAPASAVSSEAKSDTAPKKSSVLRSDAKVMTMFPPQTEGYRGVGLRNRLKITANDKLSSSGGVSRLIKEALTELHQAIRTNHPTIVPKGDKGSSYDHLADEMHNLLDAVGTSGKFGDNQTAFFPDHYPLTEEQLRNSSSGLRIGGRKSFYAATSPNFNTITGKRLIEQFGPELIAKYFSMYFDALLTAHETGQELVLLTTIGGDNRGYPTKLASMGMAHAITLFNRKVMAEGGHTSVKEITMVDYEVYKTLNSANLMPSVVRNSDGSEVTFVDDTIGSEKSFKAGEVDPLMHIAYTDSLNHAPVTGKAIVVSNGITNELRKILTALKANESSVSAGKKYAYQALVIQCLQTLIASKIVGFDLNKLDIDPGISPRDYARRTHEVIQTLTRQQTQFAILKPYIAQLNKIHTRLMTSPSTTPAAGAGRAASGKAESKRETSTARDLGLYETADNMLKPTGCDFGNEMSSDDETVNIALDVHWGNALTAMALDEGSDRNKPEEDGRQKPLERVVLMLDDIKGLDFAFRDFLSKEKEVPLSSRVSAKELTELKTQYNKLARTATPGSYVSLELGAQHNMVVVIAPQKAFDHNTVYQQTCRGIEIADAQKASSFIYSPSYAQMKTELNKPWMATDLDPTKAARGKNLRTKSQGHQMARKAMYDAVAKVRNTTTLRQVRVTYASSPDNLLFLKNTSDVDQKLGAMRHRTMHPVDVHDVWSMTDAELLAYHPVWKRENNLSYVKGVKEGTIVPAPEPSAPEFTTTSMPRTRAIGGIQTRRGPTAGAGTAQAAPPPAQPQRHAALVLPGAAPVPPRGSTALYDATTGAMPPPAPRPPATAPRE